MAEHNDYVLVSFVLSVMFTVFPLSTTSRFIASASPVNVTNAAAWITVTQKQTYNCTLLSICQNVTYNIHSKFTIKQPGQTGGCTALMCALD